MKYYASQPSESIALSTLEGDRASIQPGDRVALIIEDDAVSASLLLDNFSRTGI